MWIILILSVIVLAAFIYASYSIQSGIYVKALCAGKTNRKVVALTFDDGPDPENTPVVLDILKKYSAAGTFFCIGKKVRGNPDVVKRIAAEGHLIGNHSYSHNGAFPCFTRRRMIGELRETQELIENITGKPCLLYRPPFGVTNPVIAAVVKHLGYPVIGWSIRSFDTRGEKTERVFRRIVKRLKPGAVILLHDRLPQSGVLLEMLLAHLSVDGYQAIRVDEMFEL